MYLNKIKILKNIYIIFLVLKISYLYQIMILIYIFENDYDIFSS